MNPETIEKVMYTETEEFFEITSLFYVCKLSKSTGQITSLKTHWTSDSCMKGDLERECVQKGSSFNKLVIHDDVPFFWDNWDIMHHAYETKWKDILLENPKIVCHNESKLVINFSCQISEKSRISQDIVFSNLTKRIDFVTDIDWHERRKLLKSYFQTNIRTDFATFECSSGLVRRPIHTNTSWDQARLEVCGHKFVDLSEGRFGVSVLNDCKYGFTVREQTIGLSLLKAPEFPWEGTDKMNHKFTYSVLPHALPLSESNVFYEAALLNTPLWSFVVDKD